MITTTDPARELADLCGSLYVQSSALGDAYLAERFDVKPWSSEFFQIIFCILERADSWIALVNQLALDADYKAEAIGHVEQIKLAFARQSLMNNWHSSGCGASFLAPVNVQPLKMLSPTIRLMVSYPKLDDEQVAEIGAMVGELLNWLEDHQLAEQDFLRQALIEGLQKFQFRLKKSRWLGWGFTVRSLKDVIAAYMALEHIADPVSSPDAEAVLKKTRAFIADFFRRIGTAKETVDRADFLLRAYGAVSLVQQGTTIAGLLTHMTR